MVIGKLQVFDCYVQLLPKDGMGPESDIRNSRYGSSSRHIDVIEDLDRLVEAR